ncbi:MAG: STAS/SEC14 domain-containing protein [Jiangellales bacterium]
MIELVDDVGHGVFGLRAGGIVTPDEYSAVVRPALDGWLDSTESLRVLAIVDHDFAYAEGDWRTASAGVLERREWSRLGVVTDAGWLRRMAPIGSMFVPARLKTFRTDRLDDAIQWVSR